jgi:hypothetical protein
VSAAVDRVAPAVEVPETRRIIELADGYRITQVLSSPISR